MKLLKLFVFGLLSLMMLAMVAIYLSPLDAYVPEVEQALGNQLHEPVSVRYLRLAALPIPHLELQGVLLCGREGIAVKSMDIELDLAGWLADGKKVVRRIGDVWCRRIQCQCDEPECVEGYFQRVGDVTISHARAHVAGLACKR